MNIFFAYNQFGNFFLQTNVDNVSGAQYIYIVRLLNSTKPNSSFKKIHFFYSFCFLSTHSIQQCETLLKFRRALLFATIHIW